MQLALPTHLESLFETDAGNAVYDALVQANIDPRTVSLDVVKSLLLAEVRIRSLLGLRG